MAALSDFRLLRPGSAADAVRLRGEHPGSRFLAGGTDLLPNMRRGLVKAEAIIDLGGVAELAELRKQDPALRILDVRSREEFEAVNISGSVLMSQDVMRQIMADGSNTRPLVIVDHQGKKAMDAAAYFMGHGLQNVRCLRGGIDAWAQEVETGMRRYKLG